MNDQWLPPVEDIAASFVAWEDQRTPSVLVDAARASSNRGLATLLSWWELQGRPLAPALAAELDCQRQRLARYARVLERVRQLEPGAVAAKGPIAWKHYPPGLVRQTSDLDVILPSAPALWTVTGHLIEDGWSPGAVWVWRLDGAVHFHLVLKRPHEHPMLMARDKVELTTIAYPGDHLRREPRVRTWLDDVPTMSDWLLWLIEELGERRFRMRDVFDLAVMLHAAEDEGADAFVADAGALVARYGARPQLRALLRHADRHYPPGAPLLRRVGGRAAELHSRRLPWALRRDPRTASLAALVALARAPRRSVLRERADDLLIVAQRRARGDQLLDLGLPLYGMPVADSEASPEVRLCSGGDGAVWLDCPAGRFITTLGSALRQQWVERATSGVRPVYERQLA